MVQGLITATVVGKALVAKNVWSFHLRVAADDFVAAAPGAHIDIHLPRGLIRQYSLVSTPRNDTYEIAVLREDKGRGGSRELCDRIEPGAQLAISQPRNHFALEPGKEHYLLIAGGIGITPLLAMAEGLWHQGASFAFHICAATPDNVPFLPKIRSAPWSARVVFHYSKAEPHSRLDIAGLLGSIREHAQVYACGPQSMLDSIANVADGWPPERVRIERFSPVKAQAEGGDDGAFTLSFARRSATYEIPADKTILDILVANGLSPDFSCREGTCGTCVTQVISGDLIHRDSCLYSDEQARGDRMAICVSRALPGTVLVLDL